MPPELIPSDEEYASEEDSDFAPDGAPANQDAASSDDDESDEDGNDDAAAKSGTKQSKPRKRKRVGRDHEDAEEAEDAGFENSGDEAIIEKGLKRQRKKGRKGQAEEDDEGGEGGLIKTRSMRAQEKVERKPLLDTSAATIDVDSVWAAMISGKPAPIVESDPNDKDSAAIDTATQGSLSPNAARKETLSPSTTLGDGPDSMILIKRTYKFAGKVHTEQKLVARNSAEAKLYLDSQPDAAAASEEPPPTSDPSDPLTKPKRPPRKARRSIFEPIVEGLPQRTDLHFGIRRDGKGGVALVGGVTGKEKKLNTVEKSAMDWAGFVDKEGIKDELDAAGKSKGAYKARQAFLARVEDKREEEARRARGLAA